MLQLHVFNPTDDYDDSSLHSRHSQVPGMALTRAAGISALQRSQVRGSAVSVVVLMAKLSHRERPMLAAAFCTREVRCRDEVRKDAGRLRIPVGDDLERSVVLVVARARSPVALGAARLCRPRRLASVGR